ncbi:unnamed protein product [Plutella xylostella]|uniref:(diamondback moth) hypothetical protein n=1 Tax=Plutella xylostella TaxID=51655 RepID=A0A8S4DWD7_PLUXY|nr:unnamed protein product [Plutella xylostella]
MGHTFKCFYCQQYFSNVTSLLQHTGTHQTIDKEVLLEKYITKNKRSLQADISELNCRLCDEKLADLDKSRQHLISKHNVEFFEAGNAMTEYVLKVQDGLFSCHICDDRFHNFTLLNKHMNCHVGKVVCENCGDGFLNQRLLSRHKETHDIAKFNCKHCHKTFSKKSQIRYHTQIVHQGRKRVKEKKCPHCKFEFREHSTKMLHLRDAHGITLSFECHVCKNNFPTRRALTQHKTKHHSDRFKCEFCGKCFETRSNLEQHKRGHTGERGFFCSVCKNGFMHKSTLAKHVRRVHGGPQNTRSDIDADASK